MTGTRTHASGFSRSAIARHVSSRAFISIAGTRVSGSGRNERPRSAVTISRGGGALSQLRRLCSHCSSIAIRARHGSSRSFTTRAGRLACSGCAFAPEELVQPAPTRVRSVDVFVAHDVEAAEQAAAQRDVFDARWGQRWQGVASGSLDCVSAGDVSLSGSLGICTPILEHDQQSQSLRSQGSLVVDLGLDEVYE